MYRIRQSKVPKSQKKLAEVFPWQDSYFALSVILNTIHSFVKEIRFLFKANNPGKLLNLFFAGHSGINHGL